MIAASLLVVAVPATAATATTVSASTTTATPTTVSSDALPTVQVDGVVWTQIIVGNTVYVGGSFTTATPAGATTGGVARSNMLAYNLTTGELITTFSPSFNGQVRSLAVSPDGKTVYAVGSFTQVNGVNAYRVAALNATTGAVSTTFAAKVKTNASVYSVVVTATTVYIGGIFTTANNVTRTRVAAVSATTGELLPWAPAVPDGTVRAMVVSPDGTKLVLGGSFSSVNGSTSPGRGMAMVDSVTGANLPWAVGEVIQDYGTDAAIYSLTTDGTSVYGTAYRYGSGTGTTEGSFKATWADGTIEFVADCHGDTYSAAVLNGVLYVAGHTYDCSSLPNSFGFSGQYTRAVAYTATATGTLSSGDLAGLPAPSTLDWYPTLTPGTATGQNQAAWSVASGSGYVVYGGEFTAVNGVKQTGLVRFTTKNVAPTSSFTATASDLTATFDASASTDSDGTIASYTWDFGDGSTATGVTTSHKFPATGSYTVTLTVTDNLGGKTKQASVVTVTAPPSAHLAQDAFGRTASRSLGTADTGGAWTTSGTAANFAVGSGVATLTTTNGGTMSAYLNSVSSASTDVTATVSLSALPVGGSAFAGVVGRRVGSDDYSARVSVSAAGVVSVQVLHGGTALKTTTVSGITYTPGMQLQVRLQTTGTNPTTLQARVWQAGTAEPTTWQASATDTTAALQVAGSVGIRTYLGSGVTNGSVAFTVDDFITDALG